jgi:hypothetical protein
VTPVIGRVLSSGMAKLHELDTIYSVEDAYLMLDIIIVDAANRHKASDSGEPH